MPNGPDDETKMRDYQDAYEHGMRDRKLHRQEFARVNYDLAPARAGAGGCGTFVLAVAALAIIGGAGIGVWWFFFR
jgi:hypothetical protein